jgi:hypothetical protein
LRRPRNYFDGETTEPGESYVAPATNRKGPRAYPSWRDPDNMEAARVKFFRLLRLYLFPVKLLIVLAVFFTVWAIGYATGYLDGWNNRPTVFQREESEHEQG